MDIIKNDFLQKTIKPLIWLIIWYVIFRYFLARYNINNYIYTLICCGFVFGITKMFILFIPSLDPISILSSLIINIIAGIIIGVFVLIFQIARAIWYIPLTLYRLYKNYTST